jgi:hypothetical protein
MLPIKFRFIWLSKQFQRRRFFRNRPIGNKNCMWWPCLLTDRDEMSNLHRGHSIDASYQVSVVAMFANRSGRNGNSCFWLAYFFKSSHLKPLGQMNQNFFFILFFLFAPGQTIKVLHINANIKYNLIFSMSFFFFLKIH